MRKLHLVGLTTDQKGLIFTARRGSDSGGYVVALDAEVLNAIAKAQGRPNGAAVGPVVRPGGEFTPGPGSQTRMRGLLTPREMQARLRAGRSVEDVAEEADVEVEWVERFAVPILAEQAQVVELARTLVYVNAKGAASSQRLDESVSWNLLDRGARVTDDVFDGSWTAYQLHDQVWMIRFGYRSRGRAQEARWELDVGSGELVARNKVAAELGYVEPGARLRRPPPAEPADETADETAAASTRANRRVAESAVDDEGDDGDEDEDDEDEDELQVGDEVEVDGLDDDDEDEDEDDEDEVGDEDDDGGGVATGAQASADDSPAPAGSTAGVAPKAEATDGGPAAARSAGGRATKAAPARKAGAAGKTGAAGSAAKAATAAKAADDGETSSAKRKARAKAGAKAKKAPAAAASPSPADTPAPVRGLLVSTGRVTRPTPPARGLLVTSPRMRGLTGGVAGNPPAPSTPPPASPPARSKAPAETPEPTATATATDSASAPAGGRAARPDPSSESPASPGGAGVRKAVAQVTSVRVAASRALVARAMLPKPTQAVVSRPTLSGRVNQPAAESPPVPMRPRLPRPPEASAPTPPPPSAPERPPLRLQPAALQEAPQVTPLRRAPRPDSDQDGDERPGAERPADAARSPFVPRPAPSGRPERPTAARQPGAAPRPGPRPDPTRGEAGRPVARRPEPGGADGGRRDPGGRPGPTRRPDPGRPAVRRPEEGRPAARRPEERPSEERPSGERRPNDRRLDDRARPARPDDRAGGRPVDDDDGSGPTSTVPGQRPRIAAQPAADWRPGSGRHRPPDGPPVVAPPTGIDEPRPRRRLRRPPR